MGPKSFLTRACSGKVDTGFPTRACALSKCRICRRSVSPLRCKCPVRKAQGRARPLSSLFDSEDRFGHSPAKGPVDLLRSERPKGRSDFGPTHEGRAQIRHFGVTRPRICASMSVVLVPCTDEFSLRRSHSLNPHNDLEALRPIGLPRLTAGGFDAVEHDIDGGAECTVAAALLDVS